nr:carotenoid oxygenase family protein [Nocardia neocaledoniensis]
MYKYDFTYGGSRQVLGLPAENTCGELVFVPRANSQSDDGYLMTFIHDRTRDTSHLAIIDAADLISGPIAEIRLPVQVPNGFHGNWISRHRD